jgi:hypothetical protein
MLPNIRQRERVIDTATSAEEIQEAQREASKTVHNHEGYIRVMRASYDGKQVIDGPHEAEEKVNVPIFGTAAARVGVTASATRNLGNYNSARVEVSVELPCYPELSEVRRAIEIASAILDETVPVELQKAGVPSSDESMSIA